jgi:hypothetical protein
MNKNSIIPAKALYFWANPSPTENQLVSPTLNPEYIQRCLLALIKALKPCLDFHHFNGNFLILAKRMSLSNRQTIPIICFNDFDHLQTVAQSLHCNHIIDPAAFKILAVAAENESGELYENIVRYSQQDPKTIICYVYCLFGDKMIGQLISHG